MIPTFPQKAPPLWGYIGSYEPYTLLLWTSPAVPVRTVRAYGTGKMGSQGDVADDPIWVPTARGALRGPKEVPGALCVLRTATYGAFFFGVFRVRVFFTYRTRVPGGCPPYGGAVRTYGTHHFHVPYVRTKLRTHVRGAGTRIILWKTSWGGANSGSFGWLL